MNKKKITINYLKLQRPEVLELQEPTAGSIILPRISDCSAAKPHASVDTSGFQICTRVHRMCSNDGLRWKGKVIFERSVYCLRIHTRFVHVGSPIGRQLKAA